MAVTLDYLLDRSETKLKGVHGLVREKSITLIKQAYAQGIYVAITQGLRTFAEQDALYAQGRTRPGQIVTNARSGYSIHNYGLAVDFVLFDNNKNPIWTFNNNWLKVIKMGTALGFESGYYWKSFPDNPHLQYTFGLSLSQLRAGKKPPAYNGSTTPTVPTTPTTPTTPSTPSTPTSSVLRFGSRGTEVKKLQENLNKLGYSVGTVDSIFGAKTEQAVKKFQSANSLTSDGIAGTATLAKIDSLLTVTDKPTKFVAPPKFTDKTAFFKYMLPYAQRAAKGTDIPFEVCLGQWAQESGYGKSSLSQTGNNFGGITYTSNADFKIGGFAGFYTIDNFITEYIRVMNLSYYTAVRKATTIEATCIALAKSPYSANDPTYGNNILKILTDNNLSGLVATTPTTPTVPTNPTTPTTPTNPTTPTTPTPTTPSTDITTLSDAYNFQVEIISDINIFKTSKLDVISGVLRKGTLVNINGYNSNVYSLKTGGYINKNYAKSITSTISTGTLTLMLENSFKALLKSMKLNGSLNISSDGTVAGSITVGGADLAVLKQYLDTNKWTYTVG